MAAAAPAAERLVILEPVSGQTVDPPPDLSIEIDITHQSLDRLPLFAAVGIPPLSNSDATRLLRDSQTLKSTTWLRHVREWARSGQGGG